MTLPNERELEDLISDLVPASKQDVFKQAVEREVTKARKEELLFVGIDDKGQIVSFINGKVVPVKDRLNALSEGEADPE